MYKDDYVEIKTEGKHIVVTRMKDDVSCSLEIGNWLLDAFYLVVDGDDGKSYGWGFDYEYDSKYVEKLASLSVLRWVKKYTPKNGNKEFIKLSVQGLIYLPIIFYQACCAIREDLEIDYTHDFQENTHEYTTKTFKYFEQQYEKDIVGSTKSFPEFLVNAKARILQDRSSEESPLHGRFNHFIVENGLLKRKTWKDYDEGATIDEPYKTPNYVYPIFPEVAEQIHIIFNNLIYRNKFKLYHGDNVDKYTIVNQILRDVNINANREAIINSLVTDILMLNMIVDEQIVTKINLEQLGAVKLPKEYNMWDYIDLEQVANDEFIMLEKKKQELIQKVKKQKENYNMFKTKFSKLLGDRYNEITQVCFEKMKAKNEEEKQELAQREQDKRIIYDTDKKRFSEILSTETEERETTYNEIDAIQAKMDKMLQSA